MRNIYFFFFLTFFYLFSSCKTNSENTQTKTIDSLILVLDETKRELEKIDFQKLQESAHIAAFSLEKLSPFKADSLRPDIATLINNYKIVINASSDSLKDTTAQADIQNNYENVRQKYIDRELDFCKKQLSNLKHDFLKNVVEPELFQKYFTEERQNAIQIIDFVSKEKNSVAHRQNIFNTLHPEIVRLTDSLTKTTPQKHLK